MPITGRSGVEAKCAIVALALFGLINSNAGAQEQTGPAQESPPAASLAPQPPPDTAPPPTAPPTSPLSSSRPGLIDKLGDLLRDSAEGVSSSLKGTQQRLEDLNKGTLDTLSNIPIAGFAAGRSLCPRASNGAPDCYAATEKLCKEKGYTSGRSLDTESSETCNPRVYLPGHQRKAGDCRIDTFVTRAACQ
jgi:hypothetical protein